MEKLKMQSADKISQHIESIAALFPGCVTEIMESGRARRAIDFDMLRQELSGALAEGPVERYQLTWPDKRRSVLNANAPIAKTLRPCLEESEDFDGTENLYIEGDNLDVLKLLQETYLGQIKMIYIDPPYNTGKDRVYKDNFFENADDYLRRGGEYDGEGNRLVKNPDSSGRFHTDWLNMLYPRLRLARDLLRDDGVLFMSLDDMESPNAIKICDEIFGEENRIALICHRSRASVSNDKIISPNHNIVLFYAKKISEVHVLRRSIGLDPDLSGFDMDDGDGRGKYRLVPVDGPGGAKKGNPYYEFLGVEGYFRFSKATMRAKHEQGLVVKKGDGLYQKYYESTAKEARKTATTWWDDAGLMSTATSRLKTLMGGAYFDNPKPVELIGRMLKLVTNGCRDAIVMDFFSGSATTAHAVMRQNAEDGGSRKFIMVQLNELTYTGETETVTDETGAEREVYVIDEATGFPAVLRDSEARLAGYWTIPQLGRERIRRAAASLRREHPGVEFDAGFRTLKVDSTNMEDVYYRPDDIRQAEIEAMSCNIKPGRSAEDLLFQVMLDLGVSLSSRIETMDVCGKTVYNVGGGYLMACFDSEVGSETVTQIAMRRPYHFVMRDSSLASDSVAANFEQIFATHSPGTVRRVL